MDNNLQQGADDGLSHTNTANNGGGGIKSNCNGNDASSRKNNNDGASKSNEDVVLPPEGMLLCLFYVCLYTFNLTYNVSCCLCLLRGRDTYIVLAIMMECKYGSSMCITMVHICVFVCNTSYF